MRGTPYVHADFRGGLNTKAANYLVEDTQCRDCLNVQSTATGAIVKRNGVTKVADIAAAKSSNSDTTNARTIQAIEATDAGDHNLVMTDARIYKTLSNGTVSNATTEVFTEGDWTLVEATAQDSQGPVFLSNGIVSRAWNGATMVNWTMDSSSTLDAPDSPVPSHRYSIVQDSHIVIAGNDQNASTIYWSDVEIGVGTKPRTWLAENQQLFDPNDGDVITGLGRVGSNFAVFKKHKVFIVYDLNTGANRRLTSNIGCVSHRSIVETPYGTLFLAENGVYITNGNSVELVSNLITPSLLEMTDQLNATAFYYQNHYYISYPNDGVWFDYDLVLKSWWKHSLANNEKIVDFSNGFAASTEMPYCVTLSGKVGLMFEPNIFEDFENGYAWRWAGPWLSPGQARVLYPAVRKRLKALRIDGQGQAILTVDKDFYQSNTPVTPQSADGSASTTLFRSVDSTYFAGYPHNSSSLPRTNDGGYFGDYNNSTDPDTPTGPTVFGDTQGIEQSRVWGQGVARSWSLTFENAPEDLTSSRAATIQNYTIFTQERNV